MPPADNESAVRVRVQVSPVDGELMPVLADGPPDPALHALGQVERHYLTTREARDLEAAAARQARAEAAAAREAERRALDEVARTKAQLDEERAKTARMKERADRLQAALRDLHGALFGGNVYEMILRACMSVTGSKRGVYLASWGGGKFEAKAAVDAPGYPDKAPSEFLQKLAEKVRETEDPVRYPDEKGGLPDPDPGERETFDDGMAAPAALMGHPDGIVVLAGKSGGFDEDDEETLVSVGDQAGVALENNRLKDELLKSYFGVVGVLADAVEAKDPYTQGHCEQVARLARKTAERLTESAEVRSVACYGGLLHDVGKIGVSDGVLNKPGKLLPEEWDLMRSHVRVGRDLLAHVPALSEVAGVVLSHHERWDGGGYPDGLSGDAIPLAARIVCVVDAYCAMTSKRSYKESATPDEARRELVRCKGTHFDPAVVDAFLEVVADPGADEDCRDGCDLLPTLRASGALKGDKKGDNKKG